MAFSLMALVALLATVIFHRPVLTAMGRYLTYEDPIQKADAIVVLTGESPFRSLEALDIYQAGYAPMIILSSRAELAHLKRLSASRSGYGYLPYRDMGALKEGLPTEAFAVLEGKGKDTKAELSRIYDFLIEENMTQVILVSSNYHTRRVKKLFNLIAGDRISSIVRASKYSKFFDPQWWWLASWSRRFLFSEYLKLATISLLRIQRRPAARPEG